jgi:hypothetical protein
MTKKRIALCTSTSLVALALLAGCENTADKQRKADQAQAEADQQKAMAQQQAQQKAAEAQNSAQQQATKGQETANDLQNQTDAELRREQADYSSKVRGELSDLNGKITDLHGASVAEPTATKKADDDRVLGELSVRRDALSVDVQSIATATATTWPALKDKIDKDLDDSKSSARTALSHIKSSPR